MKIRAYANDDLEKIMNLASEKTKADKSIIKTRFSGLGVADTLWVLEDNKEFKGYAWFKVRGDVCSIKALHLVKFDRTFYMTILKQIEKFCKSKNVKKLKSGIIKLNQEISDIYSQLGYEQTQDVMGLAFTKKI